MTSAEATIKSASKDLSANEYSWACFKAHQAAEKALLWGAGNPRYGHSLKKLYEETRKTLETMKKCLENV